MFNDKSKLELPSHLWLTRMDIIVGLVLSSFLINVMGLVFPISMLQFYDRIIPNQSYSTLVMLVLIILSAFALETVLKFFRAHVSSWANARFTYNISGILYKKLMRAKLSDFERDTPGAYLDKFNSADSIKEHYCGQNLIMLVDMPFVVVYFALVFFISKVLVIVPVIVVLYMIFSELGNEEKNSEQLQRKTNISEVKNKFLIEMISGIHTIKSLGMEEQFMRRYERLHQQEITSNYEYIQTSAATHQSGSILSQVAIVLTVCLGGILVMHQSLTVGGLAASVLLTGKIMQPVSKLIAYLDRRSHLTIAKEDLLYLKSFQKECDEQDNVIDSVQGTIKLQNISFQYSPDAPLVLRDVNFEIKENETVAIHGGQASGKSTLLMLMDGMLKPTAGDILIDGEKLSELDINSYRQNVSYMPTNGKLFNGTILENLTMFEVDKYGEKSKELAREIGLDAIIEKMPHGYNTEVGTGTIDLLSAGNKQQILIVRTLLNDPKLILFDEANGSLDIDSDVKLRKFLQEQKGKRTMVLVTYRPSLLAMADRHYKIENTTVKDFKWE